MPVPLDEYPIHQSPLSIAHMDTSDRNAYDRCYLNAHDRTGDVFLVTGLGQYPNLGVIDAYATVRKGDQQFTITASGSTSPGRGRSRPTTRRVTPGGATVGSTWTRNGSRRSARGRGACGSAARRWRSRPTAGWAPATGRGASGASARRSRPDAPAT